MALINDTYIFVLSEDVTQEFQATSHPVEEGIDLTDHIKRSPLSLDIAGEMVGSDYVEDFEYLSGLARDGEIIEYVGLHTLSDAVITKITSTGSAEIHGGISFAMQIKEIRIAASPYVEGSGSGGEQQIEEAPVPATEAPSKTHTVKSGDTLWGIAKSYYGNGSQFPAIFNANRDKLSDPNKIQVGQVLTIP